MQWCCTVANRNSFVCLHLNTIDYYANDRCYRYIFDFILQMLLSCCKVGAWLVWGLHCSEMTHSWSQGSGLALAAAHGATLSKCLFGWFAVEKGQLLPLKEVQDLSWEELHLLQRGQSRFSDMPQKEVGMLFSTFIVTRYIFILWSQTAGHCTTTWTHTKGRPTCSTVWKVVSKNKGLHLCTCCLAPSSWQDWISLL